MGVYYYTFSGAGISDINAEWAHVGHISSNTSACVFAPVDKTGYYLFNTSSMWTVCDSYPQGSTLYYTTIASDNTTTPPTVTYTTGDSGVAPAPTWASATSGGTGVTQPSFLRVSGSGNSAVNGVYTIVDASASGILAVWKNDNGYYITTGLSTSSGRSESWFIAPDQNSASAVFTAAENTTGNPAALLFFPWYSPLWKNTASGAVVSGMTVAVSDGTDEPEPEAPTIEPEDTAIVVPEGVPETDAAGILLGEAFLPVCPDPADIHLAKVSETGKNLAVNNFAFTVGSELTTVNTAKQALCDGWVYARVNAVPGQYLEIITWTYGDEANTVGDAQQCLGNGSMRAVIFVPRGNFYQINTDATLLWAEWIPCNGATK